MRGTEADRRLRHAIKTPPQHTTWADILSVWREADQIEVFESAWNWDHFYPLAPPHEGANLEGWTALAALAQATNRMRIGSMVNGMHHRHPAITANMAATLDYVSEGRFELGMGAGWNFMESDAYGIDLGTPRQRSDRFEEGMEVIVSLLSQETTTFAGDYYQLTDARCEPKPLQDHIPIVIGGKGRLRTLRTAARFADQWDGLFPENTVEFVQLDGILREHCEAVGRDPSEIARSIHLPFPPETDPAELAAQAKTYFEAGADIVVWSWRGPMDAARLEPLANAIANA